MIGRSIAHYHILETLGAGGMGIVFRARDEKLQRDVALKVLRREVLSDPDARARMLREARLASSLNHPNVLTIHEVGEQDGEMFIAMELVEGRPLHETIEHGLPETTLLRYALEIAEALAHAHDRGVIHRDLKSTNVMLTRSGRIKVLDFGLARRLSSNQATTVAMADQLTDTGSVMGTTPYMAPELLLGGEADARSDCWALGVLLYEMACGVRPFEGKTQFEVAARILRAEPTTIPDGVRSGLRAVISRCLEREPGRRYQQAGEVHAALELLQSTPSASIQMPRKSAPKSRLAALKVASAILVLAIVAAWIVATFRGCPGPHAPIRALAVMPLSNLSGDPGQDYLAEGLTDELINGLAGIASIKVIGRGSVIGYRGTQKKLAEIARELRVDALVEGSVSRSGDRVRVRASLARGSSGENLWAGTFERNLRDVIALQADVAQAIVDKVEVRLAEPERTRLRRSRQVDPVVYEECIRGRQAWDSYTLEGFRAAEAHFRRAIEIDPTYAPAWSGLADTHYGESSIFVPPNTAMPRARSAAEKALELDPELAEGNVSLGIVKMVFDWDWVGAERLFDRAIALKPNDANAHWWRGRLLVMRGRFDEGLAESAKALELDPLSTWFSASHGWHLLLAKRVDEALLHLRDAVRLHPEVYVNHVFLGLALEASKDPEGAVLELERAVALNENNDDLAQLGQAYASAGRKADALRMLSKLEERRKVMFVPACSMSWIYAGLGEREKALKWLEAGLEDHSECLMFLKVDRSFDSLREEDRFEALLKRVGLDE